ncbi:MAG: 16S rRNA (cytidine(1402)-2'-O)-methyltransferase [Exilispira sp.]
MPLYVVATPIGNLADITLRAIETLKSSDIILCEDTRHTIKLLNHYNIKANRLVSFYAQNEKSRIDNIIRILKENKVISLVSDGGTPCISDPGYHLINECYDNNIEVFSIPGPSAVISAISICGFSADTFLFYGFLPRKEGKIKKVLQTLQTVDGLVVIYESCYRIKSTLNIIKEIYGSSTEIFIARELTKKFEEKFKGKVVEILEKISDKIRGEFVIIINLYKNKNNVK